MERVIAHIDRHHERQPRLDELARVAGSQRVPFLAGIPPLGRPVADALPAHGRAVGREAGAGRARLGARGGLGRGPFRRRPSARPVRQLRRRDARRIQGWRCSASGCAMAMRHRHSAASTRRVPRAGSRTSSSWTEATSAALAQLKVRWPRATLDRDDEPRSRGLATQIFDERRGQGDVVAAGARTSSSRSGRRCSSSARAGRPAIRRSRAPSASRRQPRRRPGGRRESGRLAHSLPSRAAARRRARRLSLGCRTQARDAGLGARGAA